MKSELYAELRALVLAHQGPWMSPYSMKPESCSHCESRWEKISSVLDRIVDNAEAIREDRADEEARAAAVRQKIANLKVVKLPPRRT